MSLFMLAALLVQSVVVPGDNSLEKYLRSQVSDWCRSYPSGVIYSKGAYFVCGEGETRAESGTLEGVTLRVGIFQGDDFDYDCDGESGPEGTTSGESYSQFILDLLQEAVHFNVEFVTSTSWGYYNRLNGTWDGLVGLMVGNVTDMTVCHWTKSERLLDAVDYLVSTLETTESFVYLPHNLPLTRDVFLGTFSRKLWIVFLLSISLLVVSFRLSTSLHSSVRPDHEPWRWDEVILWAVAAVSQQSYSRHPRGSSCRTMFLIGYSITYLLYTGFAAGITSLLALQDHQNQLSFDDIDEMGLHLALHGDEYYYDFLQKQVESKSLIRSLERSEVDSLTQIFQKIQTPNQVGFGSTSTLLNHLRSKVEPQLRENILVVPVAHSGRLKAFLVQKSFPYKRIFNYWLLKLRENGFLDLGQKRFLKVHEAANYRSTQWLSADLRNVFSAFVFLVAGWILSVIILCFEILWEKKAAKKEKQ